MLVFFLVSLLPLACFAVGGVVRMVRLFASDPEVVFGSLRRQPWPLVTWLVCVVGAIALCALMWRSRGLIWAVARKMILEALSRKVVVVLLLFFVVLMPSLPFILRTEGNPKSQVQIVVTYALGLAEVLLCLVAVFLSTASICSEIEQKYVQVTDTKPLPRWQFLVGKLFGVVVLCSGALFLMAGAVYGLVRFVARERDLSYLSPIEARKLDIGLRRVHHEVLVTRRYMRPSPPDVTAEVDAKIKELVEQGHLELPGAREQKRQDLTTLYREQKTTIGPGYARRWAFKGFNPTTEEPLFLRFKLTRQNPEADELVLGEWRFLQVKKPTEEAAQAGARPTPHVILRISGKWPSGFYQEISVPSDVVDPNGVVIMAYFNRQGNTSISFDPYTGIEVLRKTEGFFPNYYRALLVILCHITLLAGLALMAGAALSFPVASLAVAALFIAGLIGPWVWEYHQNLLIPRTQTAVGYVLARFYWLLKVSMKGIAPGFPNLSRYSPIGDLSNGRLVSWYFVSRATVILCAVQGGAAMLLAVFFYRRRELARVIV